MAAVRGKAGRLRDLWLLVGLVFAAAVVLVVLDATFGFSDDVDQLLGFAAGATAVAVWLEVRR